MAFNNKSFKSKPIALSYVGKNDSELETHPQADISGPITRAYQLAGPGKNQERWLLRSQ